MEKLEELISMVMAENPSMKTREEAVICVLKTVLLLWKQGDIPTYKTLSFLTRMTGYTGGPCSDSVLIQGFLYGVFNHGFAD